MYDITEFTTHIYLCIVYHLLACVKPKPELYCHFQEAI
jgi:hypothetical protein